MHIRLPLAFYALIVSLGGCATVGYDSNAPQLVSGTIVAGEWTGWVRDWCGTTLPVPMAKQSGGTSCIPHGGELYRAYIKNAQIMGETVVSRRIYVAYPGHAIPDGYEHESHFVVIRAPLDFAKASGLQYIIGDIGGYDRQQNCMVDSGFSHLDKRQCPAAAYHERNHDRCVPLSEYLNHYASKP